MSVNECCNDLNEEKMNLIYVSKFQFCRRHIQTQGRLS